MFNEGSRIDGQVGVEQQVPRWVAGSLLLFALLLTIFTYCVL